MSVGILIVTHVSIGSSLLETATEALGLCPLRTMVIDVPFDSDPDACLQQTKAAIKELNEGDGVLILTDMYGSTPSNIVNRVIEDYQIAIVAGVNLPMLIRVLNYPHLSLEQITDKAVSGGRDGVILCQPEMAP